MIVVPYLLCLMELKKLFPSMKEVCRLAACVHIDAIQQIILKFLPKSLVAMTTLHLAPKSKITGVCDVTQVADDKHIYFRYVQ
jgi:hypothetical protein